jgi:hypothetical protein
MLQFSLGDRVTFDTDDQHRWNVAPVSLRRAEPRDIIPTGPEILDLLPVKSKPLRASGTGGTGVWWAGSEELECGKSKPKVPMNRNSGDSRYLCLGVPGGGMKVSEGRRAGSAQAAPCLAYRVFDGIPERR